MDNYVPMPAMVGPGEPSMATTLGLGDISSRTVLPILGALISILPVAGQSSYGSKELPFFIYATFCAKYNLYIFHP